jgi:hypothetical protein
MNFRSEDYLGNYPVNAACILGGGQHKAGVMASPDFIGRCGCGCGGLGHQEQNTPISHKRAVLRRTGQKGETFTLL